MTKQFKVGDWVKYEVKNDDNGDKLDDGVGEITFIYKDGTFDVYGTDFIVKPEECEPASPALKVTDFVSKDNNTEYDSYRAGFFYYNVIKLNGASLTYQFQIPIEEVGNATLKSEEKSVTMMRWIRKAIENNTMIKI
jgi:hypothetical protein